MSNNRRTQKHESHTKSIARRVAWSSNTLNNVRINYFYLRSFVSAIFEEIGKTRRDSSDLKTQMRSGFLLLILFSSYLIVYGILNLLHILLIFMGLDFRITLMAIARISVVAHKC